MGYNVYDVLRKVITYYPRKHKKIKKHFGYDLKLLSFLKTHVKFSRNLHIFKNSYLFKNNFKKSCIGATISTFYNNLEKISHKNSIV